MRQRRPSNSDGFRIAAVAPVLLGNVLFEPGRQHHAPDAEMAICNARDVYTRRNEGVSIWVVKSNEITASAPSDKGPLFEPANSKVYRHPTFFDIPAEVGHM